MAAIDQRFDRLEGDTADLKAESVATRAEIGALKVDVAEIKDRLRRLDEKLEISELRGRVEEISRRLPTTLAYSPPAHPHGTRGLGCLAAPGARCHKTQTVCRRGTVYSLPRPAATACPQVESLFVL